MKSVTELFAQESGHGIPEGLADRVLAHIIATQNADARLKRLVWGSISAISFVLFATSTVYAINAYSGSSFASYFSLIFSDMGSVSLWWKELGLSLLESLPILGTMLVLGSIFLVLWSIRKFAKHTSTFITISNARTA